MQKFIYADNSATTQLSDRALNAMLPYLKEGYGNPSSIYSLGREAKRAVEKARSEIAEILGAEEKEIFFTSSGSESDNWAIKGALQRLKGRGKNHLIVSAIEHHAVLTTAEKLQKEGFEVSFIPVNEKGFVDPKDIEKEIKDTTALVSIIYVNNEIGTIQPIPEIAKICKDKGVWFHTDAVQAAGHLSLKVKELGVDMLSISAHKFHGPKGVGALYIRKGVSIENLITGGGQERGRRAATENVAGIVGMAEALKEAYENIEEKEEKAGALRDKLLDLLKDVPRTYVNGSMENRVPGNLNISFEGVEGEAILLSLDFKGIMASSGSACTSGSLDPSHVLLAIGRPHEIAHGSVRFSLTHENTDEEIEYIAQSTKEVIEKLRAMSPVWENLIK